MNLYKQIYKKQKFVTFPATEDKEVKLLSTQQSQSFCYHILIWKTNHFSRSTHQCKKYRIHFPDKCLRFISRRFGREASVYFNNFHPATNMFTIFFFD